jgi:hypothetical protein
MGRKGKHLLKIEEIFRGKAHSNTRKLIQNILTITDAFLNQKRVNVYDHMIKMASQESFLKVSPGGCHLYRVFTYIYSLLIEKGICDCQNILNVSVCLCAFPLEMSSMCNKSFPVPFPYFVFTLEYSLIQEWE